MKVLAVIRESDCIGCAKCINACPVDAILGSNQLMHTVIGSECIGCKLCLPPCPVDCIELVPVAPSHPRIPPEQVKSRYQARRQRLNSAEDDKVVAFQSSSSAERKAYIQDAIARAKAKHLSRDPAK